jgi:hypothetical protein
MTVSTTGGRKAMNQLTRKEPTMSLSATKHQTKDLLTMLMEKQTKWQQKKWRMMMIPATKMMMTMTVGIT